MKHPPLSVQTPSKPRAASSTTPPVTPTKDRTTQDAPVNADILRYSDDLEIHRDNKNQPIQFGHGVWSTVYKASSRPASDPSSSLLTPPTSPATTTTTSGGRIVAVKSPVRRDAHTVLEAEARVLTRVALSPGSDRHVVQFLGFIPRSHSLVMAAVPGALSGYIEEQAVVARERRSTQSMLDPVLGMGPWVDLARKLISGLAWLHDHQIVHGDIKPHNILLQPGPANNDTGDLFPYDPLFADFSSAHNHPPETLSSSPGVNATTLTALTPPFAAPELLVPSALKSPDIHPTPASDVFSLAVTLLAAATGDLLLYPGSSHMQRLAMAREGHRVIEFARSGMNGMRVPRNGAVERVVSVAVCREPEKRIGVREWVGIVDGL